VPSVSIESSCGKRGACVQTGGRRPRAPGDRAACKQGMGTPLMGRTCDGWRERSPGGQQQARKRGQRARQRRAQRRALGEAAAAPGPARRAVGPAHAAEHTSDRARSLLS